jgi:hypothetical protein
MKELMKLQYSRYLLILAGFISITITGCSQTVPPYSETDGFSMAYPKRGDDVHAVVEALLNRWADPHLTNDKFNGVIRCEVISARVLQADNISPRPDETMTSFVIHGHTIAHFPNGQVLDTEHCDAITGWWYQGHLRHLEISQWSSGTDAVWGTPALDNLDPKVVAETQDEIRNSHDLISLQFALNLPASLYDLLYHFRGHDVVNTQYDFTSWQKANQIAMKYVDMAFGPDAKGGLMPWMQNDNRSHTDVSQPVTPPPPQPAVVAKPVFGQVTITVIPQVAFSIPVSDPKWAQYKSALPQFQFDSVSWSAMAQQGAPHIEMEKRLYLEITASLKQAQKQSGVADQPMINELAQAGYIAQQPGATLRQRSDFTALRMKDGPALERSTKYLVAIQILLRAIQDDITTQMGGG